MKKTLPKGVFLTYAYSFHNYAGDDTDDLIVTYKDGFFMVDGSELATLRLLAQYHASGKAFHGGGDDSGWYFSLDRTDSFLGGDFSITMR